VFTAARGLVSSGWAHDRVVGGRIIIEVPREGLEPLTCPLFLVHSERKPRIGISRARHARARARGRRAAIAPQLLFALGSVALLAGAFLAVAIFVERVAMSVVG